MLGTIIPRPIGVVSTVDREGRVNVAPYSSFNLVSSAPPAIQFSVSRRPSGERKDTERNIRDLGEFVVGIPPVEFLHQVAATGAEFPPEESEAEALNLPTAASVTVRPPRISLFPVSFECRLLQFVEIGSSTSVCFGEIVSVYISDAVLKDGRPDPEKINPLCRLGGALYGRLGQVFVCPTPDKESARSFRLP